MAASRPTVFDAVVVGAGPAGSSAAIWLARAGWKVALVEKQRFPRRKVCGECIAASNLPLLHALGIGPAFEAQAGPSLRHVRLLFGDAAVQADLPPAADSVHRWGRALGRETLDTLLLHQAQAVGAEVLQPWSVQGISGRPGAWTCQIRAIESGASLALRAPLVIDAHGSWEDLPGGLQNAQSGGQTTRRQQRQGSDLFAFKANFSGVILNDAAISVLALNGGYGGMVFERAGMATLACCIRRDRLHQLRLAAPGQRAGDSVQAWLQQECAGVRSALAGATRRGPWLASGPLEPGQRVCADDLIFRVGNAAGEAHPILGEGISMALQSSALLCSQLLADGALWPALGRVAQAQAQRRYVAQWRGCFVPRLRLAAGFAQLAMRPQSAALMMSLLRAWPGLLTQGARWGGKVRTISAPLQAAIAVPAAAVPATDAPATVVRQAGLAPLVL